MLFHSERNRKYTPYTSDVKGFCFTKVSIKENQNLILQMFIIFFGLRRIYEKANKLHRVT